MSDVQAAILDSAENRIRLGGFSGFSFREIAADVGVKSSSVHYYFPTKEALGAAVARRYTDRLAEKVDAALAEGGDPREVLANAFKRTAHSETCMCPMLVMGAASGDLPKEVNVEVQRFYRMCLEKMTKNGVSQKEAAELLSIITGAIVVAAALGEKGLYDKATSDTVKAFSAPQRGSGRSGTGARELPARSPRRATS
jgi:TetR/AcrR family transcriptional regulator, transcriptional repressor for nem operon